MELVNEMNEQMHYEFNAINTYISPNGHPMSMTLEDVSDESEYTIDDRKYYSQTYKVKVRGYIIRKEDYKVERVPSRLVMTFNDSDASGIVNRRGKNRKESERVKFFYDDSENGEEKKNEFRIDVMKNDENCEVTPIDEPEKPSEIYEEVDVDDSCCDQDFDKYRHKEVRVVLEFDECTLELSFIADKEIVLEAIETENVHDLRLFVNGELMNLDGKVKFLKDDEVTVKITREDIHGESKLTLVGYDPEVVFDNDFMPETSLDEPFDVEEITVSNEEDEKE